MTDRVVNIEDAIANDLGVLFWEEDVGLFDLERDVLLMYTTDVIFLLPQVKKKKVLIAGKDLGLSTEELQTYNWTSIVDVAIETFHNRDR